jgi:hypothetical protein
MRHAQRMRAAGAAVAAGHVVLGLVAAILLEVPGALLFFGLCAAVSLLLAVLTAPLLRPRRPPDDGPGTPEPAGEPPWWPAFERDLRAWAARERTRA